MKTRSAIGIAIFCTLISFVARAVELTPFLSGLSNPLYLTHSRDGSGRLFIVERGGTIKVVQPGSTTPTVFLNISSRIVAGNEQGLLGLTFHPGYASNGRFFVHYTRAGDGAIVIAEYKVSALDPNQADFASERVLLSFTHPQANHNSGMIEFSPVDGFLYIGSGDGGGANDPNNYAQNPNTLLGKILRIDVDPANTNLLYESPADNPFHGSTPGLDEIYALGMRNPWRFSFDRLTGALYVADVGQGAREEIDIVTLGGNYGWRVFEGFRCTDLDPALCQIPDNYIFPIAEYDHSFGRCSITGGYVYRGTQGTLSQGAYVYGDYCTGEIFMLNGGVQSVLFDTALNISSFGEDATGELYVVNLNGTVHKLTPTSVPCSYAIAPTSASVASTGGSGTINVTAGAGCQWTAVSNTRWIRITAGGSGTGSGSVSYSVERNQSRKARQGSITVAGETFIVSQTGR